MVSGELMGVHKLGKQERGVGAAKARVRDGGLWLACESQTNRAVEVGVDFSGWRKVATGLGMGNAPEMALSGLLGLGMGRSWGWGRVRGAGVLLAAVGMWTVTAARVHWTRTQDWFSRLP
ncbi:Uncharacterised protein [Mycobacteroides abscessus subsp. massiliense]|nr:Uncharacterised protein [Mycobacteroides abscessus subsp. massiliense]SLH30403.1 Uncharacterised protein [Mycobacteroides abscessus subsp. massiliense]SLI03521.1 Uncharacterised protein [Mycobacteroides abscessus subsp. massiliense]